MCQQDGATAHTVRETLLLLEWYLPGRLISKGTYYPLSSNSSDLIPCCEDQEPVLQNIEELKNKIRQVLAEIPLSSIRSNKILTISPYSVCFEIKTFPISLKAVIRH